MTWSFGPSFTKPPLLVKNVAVSFIELESSFVVTLGVVDSCWGNGESDWKKTLLGIRFVSPPIFFIILQSPFKKWYSLLIQFLTIRHNHPSIRFLLPAVTSYQSHPIPQIGVGSLDCCFIYLSTFGGSRLRLPWGRWNYLSWIKEIWNFNFWRSEIRIARSVGCACFGWGRFFVVATLAAKQTKKQWLKQKTRFLFEAGCFWWIPWFEQQHVKNPQSKKKTSPEHLKIKFRLADAVKESGVPRNRA